MKRLVSFLGLAACAALLSNTGMAQSSASPQASTHPRTSTGQSANRMTADTDFMTKAAQGGMAEVELGKLAVSKATNEQVKAFGQRMVDDHSKANEELSKIAAQKGATLPSGLNAKDQATKDRLSGLSGAEFDRAYMQDMVKDHRTDVAEFKKEASKGQDSDTKNFASKTLPTLEEHLKMAESTLSQIKK